MSNRAHSIQNARDVSLPAEQVARAPSNVYRASSSPLAHPTHIRILLIEEKQADCTAVTTLLRRIFNEALDTSWVSSLEAARAAVESGDFDICLLGTESSAFDPQAYIDAISEDGRLLLPVICFQQTATEVCEQAFLSFDEMDCIAVSELEAPVLARAIKYAVSNFQLQNTLRDSELRYRSVVENTFEGVVLCDAAGTIDAVNSSFIKMVELPEDDVLNKNLFDFIAADYQSAVKAQLENDAAAPQDGSLVFKQEVEGMRQQHQRFPMVLLIRQMPLTERNKFTCILRDITFNKQQAEELQLTATAFETHTAIIITDANGTILRINPAFTRITGYESHEAVGANPKILQSGHHGQEFYKKIWQQIAQQGNWEGEIWNRRKNGQIYPEWQTITAVKNAEGQTTHYVATFSDITERKHAQALIEHQAYYDALTNLPNRRMALERLNQELSSARRHHIYGALLFIDLDHFKTLNDSMGHAAGDVLLQQMAKRLSNHVRTEDTVARLGGDEFVVILPNLDKRKKLSTATATTIAEKIHGAVSQPYQLEGGTYSFTPSIGVTLFPFEGDSADDVLKHADTAMYRAKSNGRNTICFYQPKMQAQADRRLQLEEELRHAIDNNELTLHYQAQFNIQGTFLGAEALLRWHNPRRGEITPVETIALAEEINLITPLGNWVLETAIKHYTDWRQSKLVGPDTYIAVNISPKQIQADDFVPQVKQLLSKAKLPPACLKLELTENIMLYKINSVVGKMNTLRDMGVSFAMDDFGTGFSSLSYLKQLPFNQIKIDQSFISDLSSDNNDAAIVETIIAMAEHLQLDVIAEGVETKEELALLKEKGCNNYQGFYFSTPLDASAFAQQLKQKGSLQRS